jgi:hypothetical protein
MPWTESRRACRAGNRASPIQPRSPQVRKSQFREVTNSAAEEWELLCRLPWTRGRLGNYVFDAERHGPETALHYPCMREADALGRGTRYLVTDLAREAYVTHRREFMAWLFQNRARDGPAKE